MNAYQGTAGMEVHRLSGAIAAEVTGVDLAKLDGEQFEAIRKAFLEHCVLVIRGQHLSPEELLEFSRRWGDISITPMLNYIDGCPGLFQVDNVGKDRGVTENWHSDSSFIPAPPAITILAMQEMPSVGGDTMWSNQYLAYERLSDGMKRLLEGLRAIFRGARVARQLQADVEIPWAVHPIVRIHPETGRRSLYVGNPRESVPHLEGMTVEESAPLIKFLYEQSTTPDRVYRHRWQKGDIAMWDNRCTMHYAVHDYGDEVRRLYRCTIRGEPPVS